MGHIISGPLNDIAGNGVHSRLFVGERNDTKDSLDKLWDLETTRIKEQDGVHEALIDDIGFNGERYSVNLPRKGGYANPDRNYKNALNRLQSLLEKVQKDPAIMEEYDKIFREQENEGIIERVRDEQIEEGKGKFNSCHIML